MRTNNIFNLRKFIFLFLIGTIGFSGCKKFLDVNTNPNNPDTASPNLLLPTVEAAIGQVVGNGLQITGNFYAQYWTQNPNASQYKSIDRYAQTSTFYDGVWSNIYRKALVNAQLIIDSKTANIQYTQGIAYLLKAYTFQLATDAFGDIPLSEALHGSDFRNPKYEAQQTVYDSIFTYVDKGVALLNAKNATSPGSQDLIFQGDVNQWKAFANTLKLKAYLRISTKDAAKAKAGITALYQTNPVFLTKDAAIQYTSTGGNENPLYNEMVALGKTPNIVASATAVLAFRRNNDPRLTKFYDKIPSDATTDTIAYIMQGSYLQNSNKKVSLPTPLVAANPNNPASATVPVKLFSTAESYFIQAEAVARSLGATGDITNLFTKGVTASFTATGLTVGDATVYIGSATDANIIGATTPDAKVKLIITQKYYAMTGLQGFEAWTEYRRTGYPTFLVVSKASLLGGALMPQRLLYPNSEAISNLNFPGLVPVTTPVWWATK